MKAELIIDSKGVLSEGPFWDHRKGILSWVDIEKGEFHFFEPFTSKLEYFTFNSRLGVGIPTDHQDKYLLGLQEGIAVFNLQHPDKLDFVANPESHLKNNRFNDGKCDPEGRLWIGSMDLDVKPGAANLYRLGPDFNSEKILTNLTIANGLAWDTERELMYFIDTADHCIYAFDYQRDNGEIRNKRIAVNIPGDHGGPDGMCIDEEGMLWVAHWGGFNVTRWDPINNRVIQKEKIPVPQPTSCAFGGDDMDFLYITTASLGLTESERKHYPESGGIFGLKTLVKGKKSIFFKSVSL